MALAKAHSGATVCLLGTLLLVAVQQTIPEPVGGILSSVVFFATVLIAGVVAGWKSGLSATLLGLFAALVLFSPPYYMRTHPVDFLRLVSFVGIGLAVTGVCELLQRAWKRIDDRQRRLEEEIVERRRAELSLRDADRRKDEFLAILAHELRNPLAPLRSGLDLLRFIEDDPEEVETVRGMMDRQLCHMIRLIDDLLDVSRISRNKLALKMARVPIAQIVTNAIEIVQPAVQEAGQIVCVEMPPEPVFVWGDLTRLSQVVGNLLSNSVKYTPSGGRISLSVKREADLVVIVVRDTGIGIPHEALPQIFEMFSQVDRSLERTTGGLGIGLALVKALVEMHGGTVTAHSGGVGQGSEFEIRLPCDHSVNTESPVDEPLAAVKRLRRVMVVDDNQDAAQSLAMILRHHGHDVLTVQSGHEAMDVAESFAPEVMLLDLGMPGLNGYEVAQLVRAKDWGKAMTLIAVTGWGQEHDRKRSREAGFDQHLVKPVAIEDLNRLLSQNSATINS